MDIIQVITQELKVEKWQVEAAVKLIDEATPSHSFPDTEKKQQVPLMMSSFVHSLRD